MKQFCIIDLDNMAHRMRHGAFKTPIWVGRTFDPFHDPSDEETEAEMLGILLHQVLAGIINSYNMIRPDHVVICFDRKSWRKDVFSAYKTRPEEDVTPKEILEKKVVHLTKDALYDFFDNFTNVTVLAADQCEADDFIARWTQLHPDDHHVIVSSDSDFRQLISDNVKLFDPMNRVIWTHDGAWHQPPRKRGDIMDEPPVKFFGQDWWPRKAKDGSYETVDPGMMLFEKIIRGDRSDTIPASYPRVRIDKIRQAYYGDVSEFNNFINATYGKGEHKFEVRPAFDRNQMLIDLTQQPENVKDIMDAAILAAVQRDAARMVGAYFAKFCGKYKLTKIAAQSPRFVDMLTKKY